MGVTVGAFLLILIAYFILRKKMQKSEYKEIQRLQKGTKQKKFSAEVLYQKLYITYIKIRKSSVKIFLHTINFGDLARILLKIFVPLTQIVFV